MKFDPNDLPGAPFDSLEDLNKALAAYMQKVNNAPVADFHGLNPTQMHVLLRQTFHSESPLKWKTPTIEQLQRMPFILLIVDLLKAIQAAGGLKATAKGNLPVLTCKELYGKQYILDLMIEWKITKLSKEEDYPALHAARLVATVAGYIRKVKGKFLLTKKGAKILEEQHLPAIFGELLEVHCKRFNWAYLDGIEDEHIVQHELGFLLFLLAKFGDQVRDSPFYGGELLKAFPILYDSMSSTYFSPQECMGHYISIRFMGHFACWFGFAEEKKIEKGAILKDRSFRKTPLMDEIFRFEL